MGVAVRGLAVYRYDVPYHLALLTIFIVLILYNPNIASQSIEAFRRLPVKEELGEEPIKDQKVLRTIRIGELVRQHCSEETRLVVISIPVPVTDVTTPLMYMS